MNKENLLVLAAHLDQFEDDYPDFEMSDFIEGGDPRKWEDYALHNGGVGAVCGSAACAVGHGPSAGFLFNEDEFVFGGAWTDADEYVEVMKPDWHSYCERVFGVGVNLYSDDFDFMFGGHWSRRDNTPRGAAARIRWCVNHGPMETVETYQQPTQIETYAKYRFKP